MAPRKSGLRQALKQDARPAKVRPKLNTLPSGSAWMLLTEMEAGLAWETTAARDSRMAHRDDG